MTLFDTGPDSRSIIRNIEALKIPVERIERIVLSHWHADHSGGILAFLRHRTAHTSNATPPCVVDLHPDRPIARGIAPVSAGGKVLARLPDDPSFAEIEDLRGVVEKHADGHAVAEGAVWISGEIPRVTHFEGGLPSGVRWIESKGTAGWTKEEVKIAAAPLCVRPLLKVDNLRISWMNAMLPSMWSVKGSLSFLRVFIFFIRTDDLLKQFTDARMQV